MKYSAFISYNHRDRKFAAWLHRTLETYSIPKALWGQASPVGVIGRRLPPVFQDREELAASSNLSASMQAALQQSSSLIVICSPNGAQSRWVNEEIRVFTALGRRDRIQCLIVGGEPNATTLPGLDPALEALPPALFENGGQEPLASDIRAGQDSRAAAKLKLIAGVLGVDYDQLRQREAARRQRRLMIVAGASAAGFVVMTGLAVSAVVARSEAIKQRDLARQKTLTAERTVDFVKSIFAVSDPSEARGATITAREILDRGALSIETGLAREPTVKAELGTTLGEVYSNLGLFKDGSRLIERMLQVPGVDRGTRARQYLALGETRGWQADDAGSVAALTKALALARDPVNGREDLVPRILSRLGTSQTLLGDTAAGEANIREALAISLKSTNDSVDVARDLEALGYNFLITKRYAAARLYLERALEIRIKRQGATHPTAIQDLNQLGSIAYMQHDWVNAQRLLARTLQLNEQVLGPEHPEVANALNNLARLMIERRDYRLAVPLLRRAIAINLRQRDASAPIFVFPYANLGIALRGIGDASGAEAAFNKALAPARLHRHRNLAPILVDKADLLCDRRDAAAGFALLSEAAPIMARTYAGEPWRSAWVDVVRANCLVASGRSTEARKTISLAAPIIKALWPSGSHYAARTDAVLKLARAPSQGRR